MEEITYPNHTVFIVLTAVTFNSPSKLTRSIIRFFLFKLLFLGVDNILISLFHLQHKCYLLNSYYLILTPHIYHKIYKH